MRKSKFTGEQLADCLTQAEAGVPIAELRHEYGLSQQTFHRCWSKFGAMTATEVRRVKKLELKKARLEHMVADLSLNEPILKDALRPRV